MRDQLLHKYIVVISGPSFSVWYITLVLIVNVYNSGRSHEFPPDSLLENSVPSVILEDDNNKQVS